MAHHLADASFFTHRFLEVPGERVPKEVGCAFAASLLVSPLVSIVDKAIVQEIAGGVQLMRAIGGGFTDMLVRPKVFFKKMSFRLTFLVYFGTYSVANVSEAVLDFWNIKEEHDRKMWKVSMASTANVSLLAWRDTVFARTFSSSSPANTTAKTPVRTIGLFAARDTATMTSTFYLAPQAAEYLIHHHDVNREVAGTTTSLFIPVITQFITAPMHIHAIDYFNRPLASGQERLDIIQKELGKVCFARGLRFFPAFGIGSYSNNKFREFTIRQPNEELLLTRRITRRLSHLNDLNEHMGGSSSSTTTATVAPQQPKPVVAVSPSQ